MGQRFSFLAVVCALVVSIALVFPPYAHAGPNGPAPVGQRLLAGTKDAALTLGLPLAAGAALTGGATAPAAALLLGISLIAGALEVAIYSENKLAATIALGLGATPIRGVSKFAEAGIQTVLEKGAENYLPGLINQALSPAGTKGSNTGRNANTSFDPTTCTPTNPTGTASLSAGPPLPGSPGYSASTAARGVATSRSGTFLTAGGR